MLLTRLFSRYIICSSKNARALSSSATASNEATSRHGGLHRTALDELNSILTAGTYKDERVISSPQSANIQVLSKDSASKPLQVINFCANNYLGLCNHELLVKAAKEAIDSRGFGLSSVRFICGTQDKHKELEKALADFHGMDDSILFPSCFDANAGVFEALLDNRDAVISDSLNHASLIDGIRLCKAERYRYEHSNMEQLEDILQRTYHSARVRLIVTDGVFSMDGDVAKLEEITDLAAKYGAQILIDDCHATGFFGESGRGTPEFCSVERKIDIITSTLGKALGGATGGYIASSQPIVDLLRQRARPYLFSNSVAPAVIGASLEVMKILNSPSNDAIAKLLKNTKTFRSRMASAGFTLAGNDSHPIVPVMIGDARLATEFADAMLCRGIYVIGFSYPVVPKEKARIRVQLSAAHSLDDVHRAIDAFIEVGKLKNVI